MNDFAEAINDAMRERAEQLRDYGGFLAQAGMTLDEAVVSDPQVTVGYARQLQDFPEG
jgi:hypothetical protein